MLASIKLEAEVVNLQYATTSFKKKYEWGIGPAVPIASQSQSKQRPEDWTPVIQYVIRHYADWVTSTHTTKLLWSSS